MFTDRQHHVNFGGVYWSLSRQVKRSLSTEYGWIRRQDTFIINFLEITGIVRNLDERS